MRRLNFTNTQIASIQTARDINRGVVLNLIRRRQPISRADLARVSGLQRSTVSQITEQLIHERWVVDGPTGRLPRGRRPTFLQLNDRRAIVVVDLRPSTTAIAISDANGRFLSQEGIHTPSDAETAVPVLAQKIRQLIANHPDLIFEGIGISVPGRFDDYQQRVVFAPNLKWQQFDLRGPLERATGLRVELENAANACVLAEVWFGSGERARDLVVVTISEGVGVGVFSHGHLVKGWNGLAGEFGHVSLDPDGPLCGCGARGCWEVFASNWAAVRYYNESSAAANGPTFSDLLSLAKSGDTLALKAFDRMAHGIGRGLRMIVAGVSPEEIVFVGEFTRLWSRVGPLIEASVASAALVGNPPRVRPAEADPSTARLRGTVAMVLQKHFGPSLGNEARGPKPAPRRAHLRRLARAGGMKN
ncbi:MAG TPA: ROK family transcriptional regulator [Candidatus Acidoferrum sp.]|nr:ROK family transcriptional regulator [Candidatus Acidoferrum sp.]